jgi:hypothetical protein
VTKKEIPAGSVLYNLEPLFDGCRSIPLGYLDLLRRFEVLDYQRRNVAFLGAHDINARFVRYGYHPELERPAFTSSKDIDVLFVGSQSPRRSRILSTIPGIVTAQGCYGHDLDRLIARAKVVVNLHYCEEPHPLEVVRLNYLMANGCCVVSEPGWDDEDNALYAHGLVLTQDVAAACAALLSDIGRRAALSSRAVKTIRRIPMGRP